MTCRSLVGHQYAATPEFAGDKSLDTVPGFQQFQYSRDFLGLDSIHGDSGLIPGGYMDCVSLFGPNTGAGRLMGTRCQCAVVLLNFE